MTKRRLFWFGFAACLCLAVFWGVRLLTPPHRINRESFEKIQVGMTQGEIEKLFGVPPGEYTTGPYRLDRWGGTGLLQNCFADMYWLADEGEVFVYLDDQKERVSSMVFSNVIRLKESFLDKFRAWLGGAKKNDTN
jgi:hypothetical protein